MFCGKRKKREIEIENKLREEQELDIIKKKWKLV